MRGGGRREGKRGGGEERGERRGGGGGRGRREGERREGEEGERGIMGGRKRMCNRDCSRSGNPFPNGSTRMLLFRETTAVRHTSHHPQS